MQSGRIEWENFDYFYGFSIKPQQWEYVASGSIHAKLLEIVCWSEFKWVKYAETNEATYYYVSTTFYQGTGYKGALGERPTPDKHGAYPRPVFELKDYKKPQEEGASDHPALLSAHPAQVSSRGTHVEFDCNEGRQRVQPLYAFGGHMAGGAVGITRYFWQAMLEPQEWKKVEQGSVAEILLSVVCK